MSNAQECPLAQQLNTVQIQPFHHYPSHDTCIDPDNTLPSKFNDDEPEDFLTTNPKSHNKTKHKLHGDAHTPPLARQVHIQQIIIKTMPKK